MILNLKSIFEVSGEKLVFDTDIDLSETGFNGAKPFVRPLHVNGTVENRTEIVRLNMTVKTELKMCCDRCLDEFEREYELSFEHLLKWIYLHLHFL